MNMNNFMPRYLLLILGFAATNALDECDWPLGMQSGDILDEDISASSAFNYPDVAPENARLELSIRSGAWCPKNDKGDYSDEYLQINLTTTKKLTAVATQGRYDNGAGIEYVSQYKLLYTRPGSTSWETFTDGNGTQVLKGNADTSTVVKHLLDPAVKASAVRFVPTGVQEKTVCMRVELYGCNDTDVATGTMPELNTNDALTNNEMWLIIAGAAIAACLAAIMVSVYVYRKKRNTIVDNPRIRSDNWPELKPKTVLRNSSSQSKAMERLAYHRASMGNEKPSHNLLEKDDSRRETNGENYFPKTQTRTVHGNPPLQAKVEEPLIEHRYNRAYGMPASFY